jgi:eukaryotic-like serine/threonine-protein kinase
MGGHVELMLISGPLQGQRFVFDQRTTCLIGRGSDCNIVIPEPEERRVISRHHCVLDINPPDVRIRDLGSLNGTFLNGINIGQRASQEAASHDNAAQFSECDARDGDIVRVGTTEFRIRAIPEKVCETAGASTEAFIPSDSIQPLERLFEPARLGTRAAGAIEGYTLIRELGKGGMGAVYLAREKATGLEVALKFMLPRIAPTPQAQRAFLREIANSKALRHEHVVQLYDAGSSHGIFYFTLEYCDAGSIAQLIRRRGPLPVEEAVGYGLQTLRGLNYVHSVPVGSVKLKDGLLGRGQGLVHRDIKPANLFLCSAAGGYRAKVGDYGLAKAFDLAGLSGHTGTGEVGGTFQYMPRQQLRNYRDAGPEVDIWAVAASLYQMLTGHVPRDFRCGLDGWRVVLETKPIPILRRNPAIPPRLAEVLDHALLDDPVIGFQTAAEFEYALIQVL